MVPTAALRVLCRSLYQMAPAHVLDLNESEALADMLAASFWNSSVDDKRDVNINATALPSAAAKIATVVSRVRCMPQGFISQSAWRTWLPSCISVVLSKSWLADELLSVATTMQNLCAFGFATALDFRERKLAPYLFSWATLVSSLGCRKFMREYSALFYDDISWFLTTCTKVPVSSAFMWPELGRNHVVNRAVTVHLLQADEFSLHEVIDTSRCQSETKQDCHGTRPNFINHSDTSLKETNECSLYCRLFRRFSTVNTALFLRPHSEMRLLKCQACQRLLSKSCTIRKDGFMLRVIRSIHLVSRLCRPSHEALQVASLCATHSLRFSLSRNLDLTCLMISSLSSISDSFASSNKIPLAFCTLHKHLTTKHTDMRFARHTCIISIGAANHSTCSFEKRMTTGVSISRNSMAHQFGAAVFPSSLICQMIDRHAKCVCEAAPLALSFWRSWLRFVVHSGKQSITRAQHHSLTVTTQLCQRWVANRQVNPYGSAIFIDSLGNSVESMSPGLSFDKIFGGEKSALEICLFRREQAQLKLSDHKSW